MKRWLPTLLAVCLATLGNAGADEGQAPGKPNVLFLIADDLNNDLGCFGHPMVKSPHIDRLAARGVRFQHAYCQYPLCNPSRASFLTGLRPDSSGVHNNGVHFRTNVPNVVTLPQFFRNHGYFTARVGKLFHYGVPGEIGTSGVMDDPRSWDQTVNPRGRDKDDEDQIFSLVPGQFGGTLSWLAAAGTDEEQTDGIAAQEAIELLERLKQRQQPFFLAVGFYRPHTPFVAPKKYFELYPKERVPVAKVPEGYAQTVPAAALGSSKKEHALLDDNLRREALQAYWASISFMDAQVGKVLDALQKLGLAENTIVVMTSDHGYHLGEHGLWQKQSLFEQSARVPLVIALPGMKTAGQTSPRFAELIDLYPTLVEAAGFEPPAHVQGQSLAPQLADPQASGKAGAITQVLRGRPNGEGIKGYSLRTENFRYTVWDGGRAGVELYDHRSDPQEYRNLAENPQHAATLKEMQALLEKLLAPMPRAN